jgi:hypothetical protein
MDNNVPIELINKVINLGHVSREIYCDHCKKFTKHVIVSYADSIDLAPLKRDSFFMKRFKGILGHTLDYLPGYPILVGNQYACTNCRRTDLKGGIFS